MSKSNLAKDELFKYCKWVLREKPDQVISIILKYDKTKLHPEDVIEFLREWEGDGDTPLVLKYLKALIEKKSDTSKNLFNTLAHEYIKQLFLLKNPNKDYLYKWENEEKLKIDREIFQRFLKEHDNYDVSFVLKKIKDSWMMEEMIILLIKANKYTKALETYLDKGMNKAAEEFWAEMEPERQLITTLFEIYMNRAKKCEEELETFMTQGNRSKNFALTKIEKENNEKLAMELLKKYACNPALDTERVLQAFPESWDWMEIGGYTVMTYLSTVFDHKLSLQENLSIGEGLSSMEYRNMNYKLAQKKQSYVKITSDYIWNLWKSRLDIDKLYVYPNGDVVHKHWGTKDMASGNIVGFPIL
jgi:hypothetical protein